jgi:translation initiation factor 1
MPDDDRRLVYSSDAGLLAEPKRDRPQQKQTNATPDDGIVRVARAPRRGGVSSVVTGLAEREIADVAKQLKRLCGSGGTAKNGVVEIQGDHRDTIVAWFEKQGRKAKKAGG